MSADIIRYSERMAQSPTLTFKDAVLAELDDLRAALAAKTEGAARDIVPGKMHCARCHFSLLRNKLYVNSGTIGAGGNETEPCPNGCGPLWPITWEQEARDGYKLMDDLFERAKKAEDALAAMPAIRKDGEAVAYRMEMKPGDYSFMDAKHWRYNKKMYLGARVHELTLGRLIHEPDQDEETLLLFPAIVESRLEAAPHPVMDDKSAKPVKCKHDWPHSDRGVDTDGACTKCGMSFQRYIHTEMP